MDDDDAARFDDLGTTAPGREAAAVLPPLTGSRLAPPAMTPLPRMAAPPLKTEPPRSSDAELFESSVVVVSRVPNGAWPSKSSARLITACVGVSPRRSRELARRSALELPPAVADGALRMPFFPPSNAEGSTETEEECRPSLSAKRSRQTGSFATKEAPLSERWIASVPPIALRTSRDTACGDAEKRCVSESESIRRWAYTM